MSGRGFGTHTRDHRRSTLGGAGAAWARREQRRPKKASSGGFLRNRLPLPSRDSIYTVHPSSTVTRGGSD
jgi:hypothetical protein